MIHISKSIEVDYAHFLESHEGKCRNVHGHRAKVTATFFAVDTNKSGASEGMVVDFAVLKFLLNKEIYDVVDHSFIINVLGIKQHVLEFINEFLSDKLVLLKTPSTAEELAKWSYDRLQCAIEGRDDIRLISVEWCESPTSCVVYSE